MLVVCYGSLRKGTSRMKKIWLITISLVLGFSVLLQAESSKKPSVPATPNKAPAATATLPTPLPADRFQGRVRAAYKAAAEIPDVIAGLACYCGCNKSQGHRNLLDCFVDEHGATCNHCVNEALDAHAMFMTGAPPAEIRQFIDEKYGPQP